ncbi:MAG: type VI secretion system tube protein Hcp, partial [Bacteroidota bacterium]
MKMSINLVLFFAVLSLPNFLFAQIEAKRQHKPMSVSKPIEATSPAAFDAFLEIEGIEGESKGGTLEVESWSWGETNAGSLSHGGGMGSGKVSMQDFNFMKKTDKASPQLAKTCASGKHIASAKLFVRKQGGTQQEYYVITLSDCMVSSYQTGGSSGVPTDSFSLNFSKIEIVYCTQDEKSVV